MKNKLEKQKTNPLDNLSDTLEKLTDLYDEGPLVQDPKTKEYLTPGQAKIKRNMNNKKRTEPFSKKPKIKSKVLLDPKIPYVYKPEPNNNVIENLKKDREKPSSDFYKGLGQFIPKLKI